MAPWMRAATVLAAVATAAPAAAQVTPRPLIGLHEQAQQQQQRLADQTQLQGLLAAQARQQTLQTLQALELTRPVSPIVPPDYPATSSVRRRTGTEPREAAPQTAQPAAPGLPADASTRGDLPL